MEDSKSVATPKSKITKELSPTIDLENKESIEIPLYVQLKLVEQIQLMHWEYLQNLVQILKNWTDVKQVFRYLKGTLDQKLEFSKDSNSIISQADADWGSNVDWLHFNVSRWLHDSEFKTTTNRCFVNHRSGIGIYGSFSRMSRYNID